MARKGERAINFIDITGKTYGYLTVLKFSKIKIRLSYWECLCKCGETIVVSRNDLKRGHTQSCGCFNKELTGKRFLTHGMSKTRFYSIWGNMLARCTNPNNPDYYNYGGRGITIFPMWLTFEQFYKDNIQSYIQHVEEFGEKNTTLDRWPNVNANYEPGNIRWATITEQERNRRDSVISDNYYEHCKQKQQVAAFLRKCVIGNRNNTLFEYRFDISVEKFRKYIESLWIEGMTWTNYGRGKGRWQFDHILGCNNFDLSKKEDLQRCFHYTNLQPLWHEDHIKKSKLVISRI